jgi:hypothetical protein
MAAYLKEDSGESLAAAIYGGSYLLMGLFFVMTNRQILIRRPQLCKSAIPPAEARAILRFGALGQIPYALAVVLAFVSPYITLAICAACAIYYALPVASSGARGGQSDASIA